MKDRKKRRDTKAEVRAHKKRSQYTARVVTVAILVAIIAIASFLIYSYLKPSSNQAITPTTQLKAAIVDHLSLTFLNQTFIQKATTILETANFTVDYYPGENVTVKFYRNLPTHGYSLIVLRVHSALRRGVEPPLCLFSSENYSQGKYFLEEYYDRLVSVAYSEEEANRGNLYYGITPKFIQQDMKGTFQNVAIIMMGCNGLTELLYPYPVPLSMPQAFIEKGAKVYISWSLAVSASHTDQATTRLLEHLITEKQTIKQAVAETMNEVGPDPVNDSELDYYPETAEVENHVIPKLKSNLTTKVAETNPKIAAIPVDYIWILLKPRG